MIREARFVLCGLLFSLILKIVPKDEEGIIIIEAVYYYAASHSAYLRKAINATTDPA